MLDFLIDIVKIQVVVQQYRQKEDKMHCRKMGQISVFEVCPAHLLKQHMLLI